MTQRLRPYRGRASDSGAADIQQPRRTVLATFVTLLTLAGMVVGAPPAAAAATCFGHRPTITGTSDHDTLVGTRGRDVIMGFRGNDTIRGRGGDDIICGGPGHDAIRGGSGSDRIHGQSGSDNIRGGSGRDRIAGGGAHDIIRGGTARDVLRGASGADLIGGGHGHDRIYGGSGPDRLNGARKNDVIRGGSGDDLIHGNIGYDKLHGQRGNDVLYGDKRTNKLYGGPGDDELHGAKWSADALNGGTGNDLLEGGEKGWSSAEYDRDHPAITADLAAGTVTSADGDDRLVNIHHIEGTHSADVLRGSAGKDELWGWNGDDVIDGRGGNDTLYGGAGDDRMGGGEGADEFIDADGDNNIDGGPHADSVTYHEPADGYCRPSGCPRAPTGGVDVDLAAGTARHSHGTDLVSSIENVYGTPFDDVMTGAAESNRFHAGDGDDRLRGGDGDDTFYGGSGNDRMIGDGGDDEFLDALGDNHIDGGAHPDSGMGDYVTYQYLAGDPHNLRPRTGVNADLAAGTAEHSTGTDTLVGIENVYGTRNADVLLGNDADNYLRGGNADDYLEGRGGNDILRGDYSGSRAGDEADGGAGFDVCEAQTTRNCEREYNEETDPDLE